MIKKISILWIILVTNSITAQAQVYFTKNGQITFFSKTILENISAENNQVISIMNIQTGEFKFSLLNRAFNFPKAKMEDDFNDSYMESDHFPRSEFSGTIIQIKQIDFQKDGKWNVDVTGNLQIHGVTRKINVPGIIIIKDGKISASSTCTIMIKDYDIKIPSIVSNKISESIEINVSCLYQKK